MEQTSNKFFNAPVELRRGCGSAWLSGLARPSRDCLVTSPDGRTTDPILPGHLVAYAERAARIGDSDVRDRVRSARHGSRSKLRSTKPNSRRAMRHIGATASSPAPTNGNRQHRQFRRIWRRPTEPGCGAQNAIASRPAPTNGNRQYRQFRWIWQRSIEREIGAQKRTRTSTGLPPPAPEAGASTNSAIWARGRRAALGRARKLVNRVAAPVSPAIARAARPCSRRGQAPWESRFRCKRQR